MRDVFYDWFDDERAPRPVSKTPPARLAARRKLLDPCTRHRGFAASVGGCAPAADREGEGPDAGP